MSLNEKISSGWQWVQALYYRFFGRSYLCKCGHTCKRKTSLTIDGIHGVFKIPKKDPEYCPECWQEAAIKCAWCDEIILPGESVTLYTPKENFEIPEHAVFYKSEPRVQLVGCLRWACARSGVDRAGFWVMPGKVQRVATPLEILEANPVLNALIINDFSDPNQAIPIHEEPAE